MFDVIVVGAGPAGASAAIFLGREGKNVLLLDKARFPREKICGDAFSCKSIAVLRDLNLLKAIQKNSCSKINGLLLGSPNKRSVIMQLDDQVISSYTCRREIFDYVLFKEAKKYVKVIEKFKVNNLVFEGNKVIGVVGKDDEGLYQTYYASVVIGADGAMSKVAQCMRKKKKKSYLNKSHSAVAIRGYFRNVDIDEHIIELYFLKELLPGYFWVFPTGDGITNIGLGIHSKALKNKKLKQLLDIILKDGYFKDKFKNAIQITPIKGWSLPMAIHRHSIVCDGCLLVGDAAKLINPLTGDGNGTALFSGQIAAETIIDALRMNNFSADFFKQYEIDLFDIVGEHLKQACLLQKALRHPFVINSFFYALERSSVLQKKTIDTLLGINV